MSLILDIHAFLGCPTPDAWIEAALADQETLLIDHKNCEFKAASTALSLIAKYNTHLDLINMMSRLAREELVHHEQVLRLMKRRGVPLRPVSAGRYASGLRRLSSPRSFMNRPPTARMPRATTMTTSRGAGRRRSRASPWRSSSSQAS